MFICGKIVSKVNVTDDEFSFPDESFIQIIIVLVPSVHVSPVIFVPQLAKLFTEEGEVRQLTAGGISKAFGRGEITDPDSNIEWSRGAMQRGGAATSQAFFAEHANAPVTEAAYNQVSSDKPEEAKSAMSYHREAGSITPSETSHTLTSKVFQNYLRKKPDEMAGIS